MSIHMPQKLCTWQNGRCPGKSSRWSLTYADAESSKKNKNHESSITNPEAKPMQWHLKLKMKPSACDKDMQWQSTKIPRQSLATFFPNLACWGSSVGEKVQLTVTSDLQWKDNSQRSCCSIPLQGRAAAGRFKLPRMAGFLTGPPVVSIDGLGIFSIFSPLFIFLALALLLGSLPRFLLSAEVPSIDCVAVTFGSVAVAAHVLLGLVMPSEFNVSCTLNVMPGGSDKLPGKGHWSGRLIPTGWPCWTKLFVLPALPKSGKAVGRGDAIKNVTWRKQISENMEVSLEH